MFLYAHAFAISYGSLYFAEDNVKGAVPAQIAGAVSDKLKEYVSEKFTIGPTVERNFWKKERSVMSISRGPCHKIFF